MPFIVPFLPAIIGAGASIAGGALASKSKTTTTTPTLSPEMQGTQDKLLSVLQSMLDPSTDSTLAPIKSAAEGTINTNYAQLPNKVTRQAAARGFGSSGKLGGGLLGVESARLGDLSSLEGNMAQLSSQRQLSAEQMIQQILANNTGRKSTTPGYALPSILTSIGGTLSNGVGSSLGNLTALQTLAAMIKGGGSMVSVPNGGYSSAGGVDPALVSGEGWGGN